MKLYFFKNKETGKYLTFMVEGDNSGESYLTVDYDDEAVYSTENPNTLSELVELPAWAYTSTSSRVKADFKAGLIETVEITLP